MPSEKLTRVLRAKGIPEDEIASLSEAEGWSRVYADRKSTGPRKPDLPQICFTGFTDAEKVDLRREAEEAKMYVVSSVTKRLDFLCCGPNPGPLKLAKAEAQHVPILTREQFNCLRETGEIPPIT